MRPVRFPTISRRSLLPLALSLCALSGCAGWNKEGGRSFFGQPNGLTRGDRLSQLQTENEQLKLRIASRESDADTYEKRLLEASSDRDQMEAELQAAQSLLARYRRDRSASSTTLDTEEVPVPPTGDSWLSEEERTYMPSSSNGARRSSLKPQPRITPGALRTSPSIQRSAEELPLLEGEMRLNPPKSMILDPRIVPVPEEDSSSHSPWLPVQRGLSRETIKFDFEDDF